MSITVISIIRTRLFQVFFLALTLSLALGINYISAWTGPTNAAPDGNAPAPINVTTATQAKLGNYSVGLAANTRASLPGFGVYGNQFITQGALKIGGTGIPTQLLELAGTPGTDGIKFPDGSVQTTGIRCVTSPEFAISGTAAKTWAHGLGAQPTLMMPYLVNKIAEKGYSVGDQYYLGSQTGDGTSVAGIGLVPDSTLVTLIFPSTTVNVGLNVTEFILNKTGGPYSYITNANWRLIIRACVI